MKSQLAKVYLIPRKFYLDKSQFSNTYIHKKIVIMIFPCNIICYTFSYSLVNNYVLSTTKYILIIHVIVITKLPPPSK